MILTLLYCLNCRNAKLRRSYANVMGLTPRGRYEWCSACLQCTLYCNCAHWVVFRKWSARGWSHRSCGVWRAVSSAAALPLKRSRAGERAPAVPWGFTSLPSAHILSPIVLLIPACFVANSTGGTPVLCLCRCRCKRGLRTLSSNLFNLHGKACAPQQFSTPKRQLRGIP